MKTFATTALSLKSTAIQFNRCLGDTDGVSLSMRCHQHEIACIIIEDKLLLCVTESPFGSQSDTALSAMDGLLAGDLTDIRSLLREI